MENYCFCDVAKCKVAYDTNSNPLNCTFANKEHCGKRFGHLFITSSSSHFFNEIDFGQYFFKSWYTRFVAVMAFLKAYAVVVFMLGEKQKNEKDDRAVMLATYIKNID